MGSYKESQKLSVTRKKENCCRIMMKSSFNSNVDLGKSALEQSVIYGNEEAFRALSRYFDDGAFS